MVEHILSRNFGREKTEKLIQELAWRDYWQLIWKEKGCEIDRDLKSEQQGVFHFQIPNNILLAQTGISAIDEGINEFLKTGYMHNHMRMYVASLATNIAGSHWKEPARWMYYHLLDGDWASNALSWQWVAGTFSSKKYVANQENINKYFYSNQLNTYLDVDYDQLLQIEAPVQLKTCSVPDLQTQLPQSSLDIRIAPNNAFIYTYYNLDPVWRKNEEGERILLLEPSHFRKYPISKRCLDFALNLGKNIPDLKIFVGELNELNEFLQPDNLFYKEHPTQNWSIGTKDERDWITSVNGSFPSFFAFWKKAQEEIFS